MSDIKNTVASGIALFHKRLQEMQSLAKRVNAIANEIEGASKEMDVRTQNTAAPVPTGSNMIERISMANDQLSTLFGTLQMQLDRIEGGLGIAREFEAKGRAPAGFIRGGIKVPSEADYQYDARQGTAEGPAA